MNILYIDDDAEDREIFREAVQSIDPDIVFNVAQDGLEGLKTIRESSIVPDFIFLDVNMPRMDGRTFLNEIRKISMLHEIPTCGKKLIPFSKWGWKNSW
jgi:CheY-like chemotaxis protein